MVFDRGGGNANWMVVVDGVMDDKYACGVDNDASTTSKKTKKQEQNSVLRNCLSGN